MTEQTNLPNYFLSYKMKNPHDVAFFGSRAYVNLHPYTLYRINGKEVFIADKMRSSFISAYDCGEESGLIEIFDNETFVNIFSEENFYNIAVEVTKSSINYMKNKYGELFFINYTDYRGWAALDIKAWFTKKLGIEVKVDLYHYSIEFNNGKKYKIDTLKEYYSCIDDDLQNMVFIGTAEFDEFVRYLDKEVSEKKFISNYTWIYEGVKNGSIQFDEFIKMV